MEELNEVFLKSDEKNIEQVRKEYERVLSDGLKNIAGEYGYGIKNVDVTFDETRQNYIGSVSVYLTEKDYDETEEDKAEAIEKIETVRVGAENEQASYSKNKNNIELPDIIAIKNSIVDAYGIDYERINIYKA